MIRVLGNSVQNSLAVFEIDVGDLVATGRKETMKETNRARSRVFLFPVSFAHQAKSILLVSSPGQSVVAAVGYYIPGESDHLCVEMDGWIFGAAEHWLGI